MNSSGNVIGVHLGSNLGGNYGVTMYPILGGLTKLESELKKSSWKFTDVALDWDETYMVRGQAGSWVYAQDGTAYTDKQLDPSMGNFVSATGLDWAEDDDLWDTTESYFQESGSQELPKPKKAKKNKKKKVQKKAAGETMKQAGVQDFPRTLLQESKQRPTGDSSSSSVILTDYEDSSSSDPIQESVEVRLMDCGTLVDRLSLLRVAEGGKPRRRVLSKPFLRPEGGTGLSETERVCGVLSTRIVHSENPPLGQGTMRESGQSRGARHRQNHQAQLEALKEVVETERALDAQLAKYLGVTEPSPTERLRILRQLLPSI